MKDNIQGNRTSIEGNQNTTTFGSNNITTVKNINIQKGENNIEGYSVEPENFFEKVLLHFLKNWLKNKDLMRIYILLALPNIVLIGANIYYVVINEIILWLAILAFIVLVVSVGFYSISEERKCPQCKTNFSMIRDSVTVLKRKISKKKEEQLRELNYRCEDCGFTKATKRKFEFN